MSWFICAVGNFSPELRYHIKSIQPPTLFTYEIDKCYLAAGGSHKTCKFGSFLDSDSNLVNYVVNGAGIESDGNNYKFMDSQDWYNTLKNDNPNLQLNGHFAGIKVTEKKVFCFTDPLGTRELFLYQVKDYCFISTRLDLLLKIKNSNSIDFTNFGSLWLLESQIRSDIFVEEIKRLTESARINVDIQNKENIRLNYSQKPWEPELINNIGVAEIESKLISLSTIGFDKNNSLSLALSGGMDSRLLLSILYKYHKNNLYPFDCFSFGNKNHPDSVIANSIAKKIDVNFTQFDFPLGKPIDTFEQMKHFVLRTNLTFPASEFLLKRHYDFFADEECVIIDGCFGEILRRALFKRLLYFARNSIINYSPEVIFKYMLYPHADIFNNQINDILKNNAISEIYDYYSYSMKPDKIGVENWIDIFSIRTKQPNLCGIEQARVDDLTLSYTPFSQPDFFNLSLSLPQNYKNNGKIVKEIIKSNLPILSKFPLTKGETSVGFNSSPIKSKLVSKIKKFAGSGYKDKSKTKLYNHIKSVVMDMFNSQSFKLCDYYDHNKTEKIITGFYKGNDKFLTSLDWLTAFELYRREFEL